MVAKIIIAVVTLVLIILFVLVLAGLFKNKKSSKKPKDTKKEEPKPTEQKPKEPKQDTTFKIFRKGNTTRVSKKALQTDSRTAKVEKVFVREPEQETTNQDVVLQTTFDQTSEEFIRSMEAINNGDRKVVSLGELKKEEAERQRLLEEQKEQEFIEESEPNIKNYSLGKAGEVGGEYSGFHIGSKRSNNIIGQPVEDPEDSISDDAQTPNRFSRFTDDDFFADPDFMPFRNRIAQMQHPQPKQKKKFDVTDAVVAEAILNPKFKRKNKK